MGMDELQISGKRFISSRRIAKDNGYHTDYIGQLIRGSKVKGQKVGRTWYVDEASFAAYLGKEKGADFVEQAVVEEQPVQEEVVEEAAVPIEPATAPVVKVEPAKVEEAVVPEEGIEGEIKEEPTLVQEEEIKIPIHIEIEKKKEVIPAVITMRKHAVQAGGLKYFTEDESLLPEISNKTVVSRIDPVVSDEAVYTKTKTDEPRESSQARVGRLVFVLSATGVAVFIFCAVVSSTFFQTINVQAGNPASVGYGFNL